MRWIVRIAGAVLVGIAIFAAGLFLVPNEQVTRLLASQIEAATGREVTFEGSVRPSFYPDIGLRTGPVRIANAPWSDSGPILEAEGLNVALDLRGLLSGDLLIGDITAIAPRLILETNAEGVANWDMFGTASATPAQPSERRISLANLALTDAALRFVDRRGGSDVAITDFDVALSTPDLAGATTFAITWRRNGAPITLKGRLAETQAFLDGAATDVVADLAAAGSALRFDGRAALDGSAAGRIKADVAETDRLLAALGLPGAALPRGFGRAGTLAADMTYGANGVLRLAGLEADLEGNRFAGDLTLALAARPRVSGTLSASALDLSAFAGDGGGGSASAGWSTAPIDASALGAIDADLALATPALTYGDIRLTDVAARAVIDTARGVFTLSRAQGYGGALKGEFVANNRSGLSVRVNAEASGVDMRALLSALMGYDRIAGTGEARISALGVGQSVDAIMRSLEGDGRVAIRQGEIFGLRLGELFLNQGAAGGSTIFDDLTASFTLARGVMKNDDLTARLERFGARGAGRIDLGAQTLDYRITPVLPSREGAREIVFPVSIKGPWAAPKIGVDLEAAISQTFEAELEAERAKLREQAEAEKARLRDQAQDAVTERLGVTREEGETVEDALRRKLEEEAAKGLRNLFNR